MTSDEQEALSRAHSDDVIRLLPLRSGAIAVFNNARELCGIIKEDDLLYNPTTEAYTVWACAVNIWYPPKKAPAIDLKELGLI